MIFFRNGLILSDQLFAVPISTATTLKKNFLRHKILKFFIYLFFACLANILETPAFNRMSGYASFFKRL